MNGGNGLAYKDQEAAEQAIADWRIDYGIAITALVELNERLDSKALDAQIKFMESRLRRF